MPIKSHTKFLPLPSVEFLLECFIYVPDMGRLIWQSRPRHHFHTCNSWAVWNSKYAGKIAGCAGKRSHQIKVNDQRYQAHRIIWKLLNGKDPIDTIDHKNGNPFANGQANLRIASMGQQAWNRKTPKSNTSGYRGVTWHRRQRKWNVSILYNGIRYHLGCFDDPKKAADAYETKARELHEEFYRQASSP